MDKLEDQHMEVEHMQSSRHIYCLITIKWHFTLLPLKFRAIYILVFYLLQV